MSSPTAGVLKLESYGEVTSVVVSRGGAIVREQYLEGDRDTLRNTRSCTKTAAGMLLGIAIERASFQASTRRSASCSTSTASIRARERSRCATC